MAGIHLRDFQNTCMHKYMGNMHVKLLISRLYQPVSLKKKKDYTSQWYIEKPFQVAINGLQIVEDGDISFNITYEYVMTHTKLYSEFARQAGPGSALGKHTGQLLSTIGEFSLREYKKEKMVFSLHQNIVTRQLLQINTQNCSSLSKSPYRDGVSYSCQHIDGRTTK